MTSFSRSAVTAVLGPTNTGKTHLAVERLCAHSSGIIGFPLRLLAREVYDRVVRIKGVDQVALLTGEERIIPKNAKWFLATAESMPLNAMSGAIGGGSAGAPGAVPDDAGMPRDFSFVAIDEAQLGAHPERGHVFTDRLLRARGRDETMILGSESLAPIVRALIPEAEIIGRPRFSTLRYAGAKKLSRLPPRSAIIAFSAEEVYAVAEMLRRFRGGAAVVMGALSPATRNAQVAMYQAGEVDYLVATDAIGMGLNMDVDHVAFAALGKYDGNRRRRLHLAEMAQIAGRAGRHQRDGSFGTLSGGLAGKVSGGMGRGAIKGAEFSEEEIARIEEHDFPPLKTMFWRNAMPRFDNLDSLIADLEERPDNPVLRAAPEAIDLAVLRRLSVQQDIIRSIGGADGVQRFWSACSLPDFQQRGVEHHGNFIAQLWRYLGTGNGTIARDFIARKIADLDNVQGDVEKLGGRIAAIRTWAYVAQRRDWLDDPAEMAARSQAVEERLSDALHKALAQRFVDRRTAVLMRKLGDDAALLPVKMTQDNAIEVDGEPIGWLRGFRFEVDAGASLADRKLLLAAAERHLQGMLTKRADEMMGDAPDQFTVRASAQSVMLMWRDEPVAKLIPGSALLAPKLKLLAAIAALPDVVRARVSACLNQRLEQVIARDLAMLSRISAYSLDPKIGGGLRALLMQLVDVGGVLPRRAVDDYVAALDSEGRKTCRKAGVRLGSLDVYCSDMLKYRARTLHALLRQVALPQPQHHGAVAADGTVDADGSVDTVTHGMASANIKGLGASDTHLPPVISLSQNTGDAAALYRRFGTQKVRVDMVEKILFQAHRARPKKGSFAIADDLAVSMGLKVPNFNKLLYAAGFRQAANHSNGKPVCATAMLGSAERPLQPAPQAPILWRWRGLDKPRKAPHKPGVLTAEQAASPFAALARLNNIR